MRLLAYVLLLVTALAACGTDVTGSDAREGTSITPPPEATTDTATSPGRRSDDASDAPAVIEQLRFTAETVAGEPFDGSTLAGKDVVLWFWAPWCTECRREAPHVAGAQAANPDVVFVGVAGLGETADMRNFVDDYDVDRFDHLADLDGSLWQRFGVVQQPAYAFIDDAGAVEVVRGELGAEGLSEQLAGLTGH